MTPSTPLAVRLLLDAQDEFARLIDHLPAPARGGPLGRLNAPGWVVAHLAFTHDMWINVLVAGGTTDAWVRDWSARQTAATLDHPVAPPLDEARDAFLAVAQRATEFLAGCDAQALARPLDTPRGVYSAGYLVARASAHLFAHAGELSVIASLAGAGDPMLPGPLTRASDPEAHEEQSAEPGPPLLARLLLDARSEVVRVAEALPAPARRGALDRLNPGGFTVAHLANQEDRVWNADAQGLERDAWLRAAPVGTGKPASQQPYDEALAAFIRATARSAAYIQGLTAADHARPITTPVPGATLGAQLARSSGHLFAHAGELVAIGSLFGAPDLGLPGMLARTAGR